MLVRDVFEVHKVDNRPYLPRSLAGGEQIGLDFGSNYTEGIPIDQSKVREENAHENRTPHSLVYNDLLGNRHTVLTRDL